MSGLSKRFVSRVLAFVMLTSLMLSNVTGVSIVSAADGRKIDVWDFGCVAEADTTLYNNNVTVDMWTNNELVSASGAFSAGTTVFGDLSITHNANDRLFCYDPAATKNYGTNKYAENAFADGYTANGMYYCNGTGGDNRRFITIDNVVAGDRIVVYMSANNAASDYVHIQYMGTDVAFDQSAFFDNTPLKFEAVAPCNGQYKIWASKEGGGKPIFNRVVRVPAVTVTGAITDNGLGVDLSTATLLFKNKTTGEEVEATSFSATGYTANLAAGYEYTAVLSGATGFGFTNQTKTITTADSQILTGTTQDLVIEVKSTYKLDGKVTGFASDYDLSNLKMTLVADPETLADDVALTLDANLGYEVILEPDVTYTVLVEGANDYDVVGDATFNYNQPVTRDIELAPKATYAVSGNIAGIIEGTSIDTITFVNQEDGYTYAGTVTGSAYSGSLRDGVYSVTVTASGTSGSYTVAAGDYTTIANLPVSGAELVKDILVTPSSALKATTVEPMTWVSDVYVGYDDKTPNFATVKEAIAAIETISPAPASEADRITVHIAPGTYRDQLIINTPYISLVNDSKTEDVILTWYYGIGYKYYSSAATGANQGYYSEESVFDRYNKAIVNKWGVSNYIKSGAKGFYADGITFEASFNRYITDEEIADGVEVSGTESITTVRTYGVDVKAKSATERSTALAIEADDVEIVNCTMLGSQDTFYTGAGINVYIKNSLIEGNTDYIFGDGDVVFDGCELRFAGYTDSATGGYITAAKDTATYGYLFRNCLVSAAEGMQVATGYFGRPWGAGARVNFVNTKLQSESLISRVGWTEMSGNAPANANYGEYNTVCGLEPVATTFRVMGTAKETNETNVNDYLGGWAPKNFVADSTAAVATSIPLAITSNSDINLPYPGNTLSASFAIGNDEAVNASRIIWSRVAEDGTETVITNAAYASRSYKLTPEDTGYKIKVTIVPERIDGTVAEAQTATTDNAVLDGYQDPTESDPIIPGEGINIYLAGDSTVKDYTKDGMNMSGGIAQNEGSWGEYFQDYFDEERVTVYNYSNGGRSTRNFINEGSLDKIAANMKEGDYLFIQFGHNDCSNGSGYIVDRFVPLAIPGVAEVVDGVYPTYVGEKTATADPNYISRYGEYSYNYNDATYKGLLKVYVDTAREKGATPILVTPVSRMYFQADGTIRAHHDATDTTTGTFTTSDNAYCEAVKQLAEEEDVLLIDGFELTKALYEETYAATGRDTEAKQLMCNGDNTHNGKLGGVILGAVMAKAVQDLNLDISKYVKKPEGVIGITTIATGSKTVFTISNTSKLSANLFDGNWNITGEAAYWNEAGQKLIDLLGEYNYPGDETPEITLGNTEGTNDPISASNAAAILQKVMVDETVLPIQGVTDSWFDFLDVDLSGDLTATDAAFVLQKVLNVEFVLPAESAA